MQLEDAPSDPATTTPPSDPEARRIEAFARDIEALRAELDASVGPDDARHFEKMQRWGRTATALGYATAWLGPNLLSASMLALGQSARWTIVAHHVSHKGLDAVPSARPTMKSNVFARGKRRIVDWLDWLDPEAWDWEHNSLHHYRTGELADPDLVEHHLEPVRQADLPHAVKLATVAFWALTWRLTYYAPNTFQVLLRKKREIAARREGRAADTSEPEHLVAAFDPRTPNGRALLKKLAPYAIGRFVVGPLVFLPLGPLASLSVLANTAIAEALTNVHTFCIIAPNHAGPDVVRFDAPPEGRAEFYARQVLGSVNFTGGNDVADFLQGYLNYQIEHHLFPDLPPSKLREAQPKVEALCQKHGIPYVREGVFTRVGHLVDIMTGKSSMIRARDAKSALHVPSDTAAAAE